ncbi:phage tail protein [Salmonella enterica subsp. enterica]|uniref:Phage tail protein n=1 Tax=Salmonella enterica subsp. enterica serovar Mapo TaxID=2564752 RepID=A0A5H7IGV3_SALET|nr:phage tail protein [Salmonella enterica]EBR8049108.1 phage tail protein [Salmonella enterica subsp. enterica serovar Altona]ECB0724949.1 phage tail protein [Salmonella enterica subsp. enterica serovar Noya]ECB3741117.1 phage tail protein [Salmonella enterica subsp. enterica serovar Akanji]ECD4527315.1 phage tail protein [Salmonella enterica subsp. enterica serovar Mapo]EDK8480217.1 phage tail protein [Salmonella enterica subsp. enterica serovar Chailey]EDS7056166.1 phage tail protein [Salm
MSTTPTNTPVPSEAPQDLKFNAGKIDEFVTSVSNEYIDRFGGKHRTIAGINYAANQAISNYGYITKDSFEDGSTISLANECLRWKSNGEYYRWDGTLPKVVPPASTPDSTGGIGEGKWIGVGDASLRSNLAADDGYQLIGGLAENYSLPSSVIVVDNEPYNGDLKAAWTAAPEGSTLLLGKKDYNITGLWASGRNTKKNIMIVGLGMPEYASDWSRFVSGSGTVIQGAVKNQAKGFKLFNLGVDCGNYVSTTLYSTETYEDAVQIYGVGAKANIGIDNVRTLNSLGVSSNPGTHSILLEQLEGVTLGYVECCGGFHGLTIKCQNLRGGRAHVYGQYGDGFILKSDSGGPCSDIRMDSITIGLIDSSLLPAISLGGIYDAHDGVTIDNISIGDLRVQNASWGFIPAIGSDGYTSHVTIGNYYASQVYGNYYSLEVGNQCVNWNIGSHQCSGVSGGIKINGSAQYIILGEGSVTGSTRWGYSFAASTFTHGSLISNGNYGGVEYLGGTGFNPANVIAYSNNNGNFSALPSVLTGNALNGWVALSDFKATPNAHQVFISGSLTNGTAANAWLIAENLRPSVDTPISAWGVSSGGSLVPVEVYVRATGYLEITGYASLGTSQSVRINGSYLIA